MDKNRGYLSLFQNPVGFETSLIVNFLPDCVKGAHKKCQWPVEMSPFLSRGQGFPAFSVFASSLTRSGLP
jgi:hypothetical protein